MGVSFKGNEYTTGAGRVTLTTAVAASAKFYFSHAVIRAGAGNAGDINIGGSTVAAGAARWGFLDAGESLTIAIEGGFITSDDVYLIATNAGDLVHIIVVS